MRLGIWLLFHCFVAWSASGFGQFDCESLIAGLNQPLVWEKGTAETVRASSWWKQLREDQPVYAQSLIDEVVDNRRIPFLAEVRNPYAIEGTLTAWDTVIQNNAYRGKVNEAVMNHARGLLRRVSTDSWAFLREFSARHGYIFAVQNAACAFTGIAAIAGLSGSSNSEVAIPTTVGGLLVWSMASLMVFSREFGPVIASAKKRLQGVRFANPADALHASFHSSKTTDEGQMVEFWVGDELLFASLEHDSEQKFLRLTVFQSNANASP
jgi:hypothetical protein